VNGAALVAINCDLAAPATDDGTLTGLDISDVAEIASGKPVLVLFRDVHVLLHVFGSRTELDSGRIVQLRPLVLSPLHELVEDDAGDRPVRHSISRISRRDVDVLVATGVLSDVRQIVDGLDHLTRPTVLDALDHRKTLTRPFFETVEALTRRYRLAGLVILASDNEDIVVELATGGIFRLLEADVMVGIRGVPVQSRGNRAARNACPDHVSAIRGLLAVNDQPVVDRSVGADDHIVGADNVSAACRNARRLAVYYFLGVHARIDLSAVAKDGASEPLEILERMESCLARKPQRRTTVPEAERNPVDDLRVVDSRAVRSLELSLEILALAVAA
jgi:hypothetical protein